MSAEPLPSPVTDPDRLSMLLQEAGWAVVGGRDGAYSRLAPPPSMRPGDRYSLLVPLDREAVDFSDLLTAAARELQLGFPDVWSREILPRLSTAVADALRFRKETATPSGLIPWRQGQELIEAARATLIAGAKAFMEPARQYSNRFGPFASRYLDAVLMGQTAPGSYVVTALVPAEAHVPLRSRQVEGLGLPGIDVATGREVTDVLARALEATVEAIDHYRNTASLSAFQAGVSNGVSYELSDALRALATESDGADITIEWNRGAARVTLVDEPHTDPVSSFTFQPGDAPILERAKAQLHVAATPARETVQGRVHLLTRKDAGGPGVVGIDDGRRKYRLRLEGDDDYHRAVQAHDADDLVTISGELSREGNLTWIYSARLLSVSRPPASAPDPSSVQRRTENTTQPSLFDDPS